MPKPDGGPAFPNDFGVPGKKSVGLSLRDWFAGQALAGMLASPPVIDRTPEKVNHAGWAKNAYLFADAMLAAREK